MDDDDSASGPVTADEGATEATEAAPAAASALSTADTQPLPVLAEPPGLPVAYEAPGLPVVSGTQEAFAETVTLAADTVGLSQSIPEHPATDPGADIAAAEAGTRSTAAVSEEEAELAPPAATVAGSVGEPVAAAESMAPIEVEPAPEATVRPAPERAPAAGQGTPGTPAEEDEKPGDEPPAQRYTVWSSGPSTGSYHFGPKDE